MKINLKKFINDLRKSILDTIEEAHSYESTAALFDRAVANAVLSQVDEEATPLQVVLTRAQKAARTRKRNAAKAAKANSGASTEHSSEASA